MILRLFGCDLGDGSVLAVEAVEVAAGCGDREGHATGQEVVERLYLDRDIMDSAGVAVSQGIEHSTPVLPHPAVPSLTFGDDAAPGAELALNMTPRVGIGLVAVEDSRGLLGAGVTGLALQALLDPGVIQSLAGMSIRQGNPLALGGRRAPRFPGTSQ